MNRMCKIIAIGCSIWSLLYLSAVAQENVQEDTSMEAPAATDSPAVTEAPTVTEAPAAAATVKDLGFDTAQADTTKVDLMDPSEVTDKQRVEDASELAEQERVRRTAAAREGRIALDKAMEAMQKGQWAIAIDLFTQAQSKMQDVAMLQSELTMARQQKSEAYFQMARGLYERRREGGNLDQAQLYLKQSAATNPDNDKVAMLQSDIEKYLKRVGEHKEVLPIEDEFKYANAEKNIKELLTRGRKELEIGDYDQAEKTFEQVLNYDRYNHDALRFLERVAEKRWEAIRIERNVSVKEMMSNVEKRWLLPRKVDQNGPAENFEPSTSGLEVSESGLEKKLNDIVIDEIDFRQAPITEVIGSLVDFSRQLDPDGIGVNIIFLDPELQAGSGGGSTGSSSTAAAPDPFGFGAPAATTNATATSAKPIPPITLKLRNVTLLDALKTVTEISGLYYRVERNMVIIEREGQGRLITRFYPVDPTRWIQVSGQISAPGRGLSGSGASAADPFAASDPFSGGGGTDSAEATPDLTSLFTRYGVKIPVGGDIAYEKLISQLVVTLTPDQFPQFEDVLRKINVAPRQVEIEARFVEVKQSDLDEFGFEWILKDNAELMVQDGPGPVASRPRIQADANPVGVTGGLRFFDFDSTANAITPNQRSGDGNSFLGDVLSFSGILTNPELQVVIQALDQNGNTDLLSAPRVTTVHGVNAIIEVVQEIIYPTEFDITENDITVSGSSRASIFIPPTVEPGGFETRNIGVILNVTPTVNADNYTINLVMLPEIAELVDWLQYGSTIPLGDGSQYLVNIPQPVFASRNLTTSMIVWDGHTVVMGGLIREELSTFKDKVPILGDIPIIGRLFRSEGQRSIKRNLLIFVTARLVDPAGNSVNDQDRQDLVTSKKGGLTSSGGPVSIK